MTISVIKPVRLLGAHQTDEQILPWWKQCGYMVLKIRWLLQWKTRWGSIVLKRMITVALIKPLLLCGTQKLDDRCSGETNVVEWY